MKDNIIQAYLLSLDPNLRIAYMEEKVREGDSIIISSIYRNIKTKQYFCIAVVVNNGEYLFDEASKYSGYYSQEEVVSKDICSQVIKEVSSQLAFRKKLLSLISNNPNLENIIGAAYNNTLIIYYKKSGVLHTSKLFNSELIIDLEEKEQDYLTQFLLQFNIKVITSTQKEVGQNEFKLT